MENFSSSDSLISLKSLSWLSIAALFALTSCNDGNKYSLKQRSLVYCTEGSPTTFNPQQATSSITFDASARVMFDRLLDEDQQTGEIIPALSSSWSISEDGKHYIFKLRTGVSFHTTHFWQPKRFFNADDVIFSFRRQLINKHPFHNAGTGRYPFFEANGLHKSIKDIIKIDEHTVEFILSAPTPNFLSIMAMEFLSIQSAEYAEAMFDDRDNFDLHPIGTGAYSFQRYETDNFIRYLANKNYWRGAPKIDTLVFAISPIPSTRLARLLTGECDVMAQPEPSQLEIIQQHEELEIQTQAGLNVAYWAFNTQKPPFDDLRVRKALSLAISRNTIIKVVYNNAAALARSPLPPTMLAATTPEPTISMDQSLSKALLKEIHWNPEKIIDIWAMPVQRPYNPNARRMAELIQHDLQQVGVNSRIVSFEWSQFLDRVRRGEHDTVLLGWSADNNDADAFLTPLLSCNGAETGTNRAFWCNPKFDEQLNLARNSLAEEKLAHYRKAQEIFKTELPWLAIAHSKQYLAWRKGLENIELSPMGGINFNSVKRSITIESITTTPLETENKQ